MSNPRIHRFDFNALRDFRGPIAVKAIMDIDTNALTPPPAPVFSEQDLESARLSGKKQGYSEGFTAGKQEAKREVDEKTEAANHLISTLSHTMGDLGARYKQLLESETHYLSGLALSVARKVANEAIDARGEEIIFAIVTRCIPVIFSKPRLVIELNPAVFERTLERIETQLRESGFEGEIQFKSNPEMSVSDINLDWGSGQVNHSSETLWAEIETLMQRVPLELIFAETLNANHDSTGA